LAFVGLFHSLPLSAASVIESPTNSNTNSQRVNVLTPSYTIEIPQAIGGPNEPQVNEKLALLTPQIGVIEKYDISSTGSNSYCQKTDVDDLGIVTCIVEKGASLSTIAEEYDVSMNTIKWENNLGKTINVGKKLHILPVTGVTHTIKKGDTFGSIAKKYDVEVEDITIFNDIDETKLVPGKVIIVPNGVISSSTSSTSKSAKTSMSVPADSGYYIRPTGATTTSTFGPRWGRYHYGIDYGAKVGTPIYAAAAGVVNKIGCGSGYGKCLTIKHDNGTQTLYAHTSAIYVSAGTKVSQGQHIADIGATGNVTGPHLHFEIIKSNGSKMNVNFLK
jgi:LysM repeat protein